MNTNFLSNLAFWAVQIPAIDEVARMHHLVTSLRHDSASGKLRNAVLAGEVTSDNIVEAVEQAAYQDVARARANDVIADLQHPFNTLLAQAVQGNADEIVTQLRPHFDKHATRLAECARILPADAAPEDVLASGPSAQTAWNDIQSCAASLDSIASVRIALINDFGLTHPGPRVLAFVNVPNDDKLIGRADRLFRGAEAGITQPTRGGCWRRLVDNGIPLHLHTQGEIIAAHATAVAA